MPRALSRTPTLLFPGSGGPSGSGANGVPTGGTTGQVLAKNSNANGDAGWVTPTELDHTDLPKANGTASPGSTGLASDSGHVHPSSGSGPGWVVGAGVWSAPPESRNGGVLVLGNNTALAHPWIVPNNLVVVGLGFYLTAFTTGQAVRLMLYADNGSMQPGNLIDDMGTVTPTGTGFWSITGRSDSLTAGETVWPCLVQQGSGSMTIQCVNHSIPIPGPTAAIGQYPIMGYAATISGAAPATFTPTGTVTQSSGFNVMPRILIGT